MKTDFASIKACRERRITAVALSLLLLGLCFPANPPAMAAERFLLEGILDAEAYKTDQSSYSLSRNDGDLSGLGRLQLWSALQITSRLQWYAFAQIESADASGRWETEADLDQIALRYSSNSAQPYIIEAGKILPPVAMFSERILSTQNPLISRPDFLYADYPLGLRITGSAGWLDYRAALLDKPAINPGYLPARPDSAWRPDLGIGITPMQGLRFGLAWTKGPYLSKEVDAYLPEPADWKDLDQRIWGLEFLFSRGYAEFNSELVFARYDIPPPGKTLDVVDYFVEFKYTFTPRIYSAMRMQQNQYPFIRSTSGDGLRTQDVTIRSLELGVAYRFSAATQLKLAYHTDRWSVANVADSYYPSGHSLGLQLSHHFDVKSWFAGNGRKD